MKTIEDKIKACYLGNIPEIDQSYTMSVKDAYCGTCGTTFETYTALIVIREVTSSAVFSDYDVPHTCSCCGRKTSKFDHWFAGEHKATNTRCQVAKEQPVRFAS